MNWAQSEGPVLLEGAPRKPGLGLITKHLKGPGSWQFTSQQANILNHYPSSRKWGPFPRKQGPKVAGPVTLESLFDALIKVKPLHVLRKAISLPDDGGV